MRSELRPPPSFPPDGGLLESYLAAIVGGRLGESDDADVELADANDLALATDVDDVLACATRFSAASDAPTLGP